MVGKSIENGVLQDKNPRCRYEMKYRIGEAKAAAVEQYIKPHLKLDYYSKIQPTGAYPVISLYLDSPNLKLCRESLEGHKNRFKLRIRSYTDDLNYPRFFEIKRRVNTAIIKDRGQVKYRNIKTLLSGLSLPAVEYNGDGETLRQFQLYMRNISASPVVRIRYMRRAYEDDSENRIRVTFDRNLCYNIGSTSKVLFNGPGWQRHFIKDVVLEIKFTGRYPVWVSQMVKCFNLRAQSVSKYATSIKKACSVRFCAPKIPIKPY